MEEGEREKDAITANEEVLPISHMSQSFVKTSRKFSKTVERMMENSIIVMVGRKGAGSSVCFGGYQTTSSKYHIWVLNRYP